MVYLWAAVRTIAIVVGIIIGLFVLFLLLAGIVSAFTWSFTGGCIVLALVFGIGALFGTQLARVAKTERATSIAFLICFGFGAMGASSLLLGVLFPYEVYLWGFAHPWYLILVKHVLGSDVATPTSLTGQIVSAFFFLDLINGLGVVLPVVVAAVMLAWLLRLG
jgi:hypothetical protein